LTHHLEKFQGVESPEFEDGSDSNTVGSSKTGGVIAKPGAWTSLVHWASTQAILWVFVETLRALEAIFSALEGFLAWPDDSAFSLFAVTKVFKESNKANMFGKFWVVLICGGGGAYEGIVLGVGEEDTRYLLMPAVNLMIEVDKLTNWHWSMFWADWTFWSCWTFWLGWARSYTSLEGKDPKPKGLGSADNCSTDSVGTFWATTSRTFWSTFWSGAVDSWIVWLSCWMFTS